MSQSAPPSPPPRRDSRHIRLLGDPILSAKALPVWSLEDVPQWLVAEMKSRMKLHNGLGLAAPQLGVEARIIVAQLDKTTTAVMINPEVTERSPEMDWRLEGCLSIPGFQASIRRPTGITVTFRDEQFEAHTLQLAGLPARVVQHEIDHLEGKLITDGLSPSQRKAALRCVAKARAVA